MAERTALHGRVPRGVQDLYLETAAQRADLEARLTRVCRAWGYSQLIPPTFEYFENLALGLSPKIQEDTYRFLDHRGHTLALRPDITVQTARIVGTKLDDYPMPLRFYYIAPVFRYTEVQAGKQREFSQAGIELIGAATPEADAEVVAVAVEALRAVGIADFRVSIGQIDFFRSVLAQAGLSPALAAQVQRAVDQKSPAQVRAVLNNRTGPVEDLLAYIPSLVGGPEVLAEARTLAPWPAAQAALDNLAHIYDWLVRADLAASIVIDLSEVRGMDYYTGLTFEAFVEGIGFAVINGGRYDRLIGQFGSDLPAVGFALGVERLLMALGEPATTAHIPDALVGGCDDPACLRTLAQLRADGLRIEMDVLGRSLDELITYAEARGIPRVLAWVDGRLAPLQVERM